MKLPSNYNYNNFMKNKVDVSQEDYNNFMIDGYLKGYSDILYKNIRNSNYASIQINNAYLTYLAFLFFNI